jgi:hypothetical protein
MAGGVVTVGPAVVRYATLQDLTVLVPWFPPSLAELKLLFDRHFNTKKALIHKPIDS